MFKRREKKIEKIKKERKHGKRLTIFFLVILILGIVGAVGYQTGYAQKVIASGNLFLKLPDIINSTNNSLNKN